jgi:hypothetical protein
MKNQKEAVYSAVASITSIDNDLVVLSKEERAQVISIVAAGFEASEVAMSEAACIKYLGNPTELKKYTSSLVNNWLRKDTRLNGGAKYVTKNPGSRAGSQDDLIKNLKALRASLSDDDKIAQVDEAITARQAEIKATKAPTVEVNFDLIPADLKSKLGL